ncbi:hypothetical protein SDC9_30491 [bioreactor metagenome]|uniref:SWIM-type domain-containing protein n=1 Tax=bioreactor metagenome TaxID=1076179 RepID=A0A644UZM8_9ZZZZ|nr:hypothetical protein [Methanobrevibacter sp.]MEA4957574.1 SWIM zinc finger family protein [Methanobrevibacter sp.]
MISRLEKAENIHISDIFVDNNPDLLVVANVLGSKNNYQVSLVDGVWFCQCDDFKYRSEFGKRDIHKQEFRCKHIISVDNHVKECS